MKRLMAFLLFLIVITTAIGTPMVVTCAYWNLNTKSIQNSLNIGSWKFSTNIINDAPAGTLDLNVWIDNDTLNQTIPYTEYFVYNNQLFRVVSKQGYNPQWHGIPYSGNNVEGWAFINLSLDWYGATQRYSVGAVVRIEDRFFQAMHAGNTNDPRTHNGPTMPHSSGEPWREIMPMEDYMFNMLPNSSLRDYTSPIAMYVIEKY